MQTRARIRPAGTELCGRRSGVQCTFLTVEPPENGKISGDDCSGEGVTLAVMP